MNGPVERSKEALDELYSLTSPQSAAINSRLKSYDSERLRSEIKYCLELVDQIVSAEGRRNLRSIVFATQTTNSFPTVFSAIFLAIHEISFKNGHVLANAVGAQAALNNVQTKLNTSRNALSTVERRKNINLVKGLIQDCFVTGDVSKVALGRRRELDIENTLRRSEIETPIFEIKQGILDLTNERAPNPDIYDKVLRTIVAISNIGPSSSGAIFIGVADKKLDAERISELDGIAPIQIGGRWVVGIDREAIQLKISTERYYHLWRDKIENAKLSQALKKDILSNLDLCLYKGRHILIIAVPPQKGPSLYNGRPYARDADQTVEASAEDLIAITTRFTS